MKMNKRGFILSEVVIVASVISTILIFLYISLNRMANAYDTRNRYYDIDAMYIAMGINDILSREDFSPAEIQYYTNLIDNNGYQYIEEYADFYSNTGYTLSEAYYVKSNMVSLEQLNTSLGSDKIYLKDYIDYLKDGIQYLIIVEVQKEDDDDVYFYTLKEGDPNGA